MEENNGYSNVWTYIVGDYIDHGDYETLYDLINDLKSINRYDQKEALKAWFYDQIPSDIDPILRDLINEALLKVNWYEIIDALNEQFNNDEEGN